MEAEEWRVIPRFDDVYEVSSHGQVRRCKLAWTRGRASIPGLLLVQSLTREGYYRLGLWDGSRQCHRFVHRLVALTFLGEPPEGKITVNHRDGVKTNNRLENLEYATKAENYRHALDVLGFQPPRGAEHWNVKLSPEIVIEMRQMRAAGATVPSIGLHFGVSAGNVSLITRGKSWGHIEPRSYMDILKMQA